VRVDGDIRACVLGDMDLVRPIAMAGLRCAVVSPPGDPPSFSRSAEPLGWLEHWTQAEEMVDLLLDFGRSQSTPPVIFYQHTSDLLMLSQHRERLRGTVLYPIADPELVEDLTDKARFHDLAERLSLPVPATRFLRPSGDSPGEEIDLRFPLVFKPSVRRFDEWRKVAPTAKAVQVDDERELRELWPRLVAADTEIIAQELIIGPESAIESYHTYVDDTGEVVAEFTGKKIRTRPARFGYSTSVELTEAPDVAATGRDLAQRMDLTGVAKFDFKRGPDGELVLLEVNPRFTLWHHPAAVAGLNVPALVYADLTGQPRPPVDSARAGVRWCDLWEDAAAARDEGELGIGWLRFALGCEAKSGFARDDPMPFLRGVLARRVKGRLRRRIRRLRPGTPPVA
jgi:D-aspartate ligase